MAALVEVWPVISEAVAATAPGSTEELDFVAEEPAAEVEGDEKPFEPKYKLRLLVTIAEN